MADITKQFMSSVQAAKKAEEWANFAGDFEVRKTALGMAIALDPSCGMMEDEADRIEHTDVIVGYAAAFERYLRLGRAPH